MDRTGIDAIDSVLNDMDRAFDKVLVMNSHGNGPISELLLEMREVMIAKGHDYSGSYHTFMSFEWQAALTGNTVENAFLVLIAHKVSRLIGLATQPEPPANEPVADTWHDLGNYIVLLQAYERFKKQNGHG